MPDGETPEEHLQLRQEESAHVDRDKTNTSAATGGLFRGWFDRTERAFRPIRDVEDGVERCPMCGWELEDSCCDQCEIRFDGDGRMMPGGIEAYESELSSDELDEVLDLEDDDEELGFGAFENAVVGAYSDYHNPDLTATRSTVSHDQRMHLSARQRLARLSTPASVSARRRRHLAMRAHHVTSEGDSMNTGDEEDEDEAERRMEIESLQDFIDDQEFDDDGGDDDDDDDDDDESTVHAGHEFWSDESLYPSGFRDHSSAMPSTGHGTSSRTITSVLSDGSDQSDEGGAVSNRRRRGSARQIRLRDRDHAQRTVNSGGPGRAMDTRANTIAVGRPLTRHHRPASEHHISEDAQTESDDDEFTESVRYGPSRRSVPNRRKRTRAGTQAAASQALPATRSRASARAPRRAASSGTRMGSSHANYGSRPADDESSEGASGVIDLDGDVSMSDSPQSAVLGGRASYALLSSRPERRARADQGRSQEDAIEVDGDPTSDSSVQSPRRRRRVARHRRTQITT